MSFINQKIDSKIPDNLKSTLVLPHFKLDFTDQSLIFLLSLSPVFSYRTPYVYGRLAGIYYWGLQRVSFVILTFVLTHTYTHAHQVK